MDTETETVVLSDIYGVNEEEGVPVYDTELTLTYTEDDLWELYEPACLSHGIDEALCRCIMAAVIDAAGVNAAAWLASDMILMEDQAAALLRDIGYEQATLAGDTFEAAQNGACAIAPQAPAELSDEAASSSLTAVGSESAAIDKTDDE